MRTGTLTRLALATAGVALLVTMSVADATPVVTAPPTGVYPVWTLTPDDPSAQNHTGTISFGVPGLSDASLVVNKSADDGAETTLYTADEYEEWMSAATPWGETFGASGPSATNQMLVTRVDSSGSSTVATTTITFPRSMPAGVFGFAIGDVDIDTMQVTAIDGSGVPVPGAALGGVAFNFCGYTGAPDWCSDESTPLPVPIWDPSTGTIVSDPADDTNGTMVSFHPSTSISSITLVFHGVEGAGSPSFRLWVAGLSASVQGTVHGPAGTAMASVPLALVCPGGVVAERTTTDATGHYAFTPVAALPDCSVELDVPDGLAVVGGAAQAVDLSRGSATVDFVLEDAPVVPEFTG